jgi:hypothetical protein
MKNIKNELDVEKKKKYEITNLGKNLKRIYSAF